jgi:hypothetical protein
MIWGSAVGALYPPHHLNFLDNVVRASFVAMSILRNYKIELSKKSFVLLVLPFKLHLQPKTKIVPDLLKTSQKRTRC